MIESLRNHPTFSIIRLSAGTSPESLVRVCLTCERESRTVVVCTEGARGFSYQRKQCRLGRAIAFLTADAIAAFTTQQSSPCPISIKRYAS
jgi:hypothetical protein